ncbi:hypothetical protein BASA81_007117 [Batrachochytrium salamandrivorans]|nr:hypothetical protein BASA81_007117 [Batrachochytrium salamandrivorans]
MNCHLERDEELRAKDALRWKAWHAKNRDRYNARRRGQAKAGKHRCTAANASWSLYKAPDPASTYWTRLYEPSPDKVCLRQAQLSRAWNKIASHLSRWAVDK